MQTVKTASVQAEPVTDASRIIAVNRQSVREKMRSYLRKPFSLVAMALVMAGAAITVGAVLWVLIYTLVQGIPNLSAKLFAWEYTTQNQTMLPAIINTLFIALSALVIAVPVGVFAAIFMVEYAGSDNIFVKIVRMAAETLAGIPSIVYGIFGMLLFVQAFGWGTCVLSGALTMALMCLPLVMRTTEEALKSVPAAFREGSYALGAGKLRTIFVIVLPSAMKGIISGIILSLGRIVGETAALIYTAGTATAVASGFLKGGETLSIHLYILATNALYEKEAWAAAVVLILLVLVINGLAEFVGNRLKREY